MQQKCDRQPEHGLDGNRDRGEDRRVADRPPPDRVAGYLDEIIEADQDVIGAVVEIGIGEGKIERARQRPAGHQDEDGDQRRDEQQPRKMFTPFEPCLHARTPLAAAERSWLREWSSRRPSLSNRKRSSKRQSRPTDVPVATLPSAFGSLTDQAMSGAMRT